MAAKTTSSRSDADQNACRPWLPSRRTPARTPRRKSRCRGFSRTFWKPPSPVATAASGPRQSTRTPANLNPSARPSSGQSADTPRAMKRTPRKPAPTPVLTNHQRSHPPRPAPCAGTLLPRQRKHQPQDHLRGDERAQRTAFPIEENFSRSHAAEPMETRQSPAPPSMPTPPPAPTSPRGCGPPDRSQTTSRPAAATSIHRAANPNAPEPTDHTPLPDLPRMDRATKSTDKTPPRFPKTNHPNACLTAEESPDSSGNLSPSCICSDARSIPPPVNRAPSHPGILPRQSRHAVITWMDSPPERHTDGPSK